MKILKFILLAVLISILSILTYLGYYGYFMELSFSQKNIAEEQLVYKTQVGDYKNTKVTMDEVYHHLLNAYNIDTKHGFGIYHDNPEDVAVEKLRAEVGCILPDSINFGAIQQDEVLQYKRIEKQSVLVCEFPYKGGASILVGMMRVYPLMQEVMQAKNMDPSKVSVMEVYDVPNKRIEYRILEHE